MSHIIGRFLEILKPGMNYGSRLNIRHLHIVFPTLDLRMLPDILMPAGRRDDAMKPSASKSKVAPRKAARPAAPTVPSRSGPRSTRLPPVAPTKEKIGFQWTFLTNHSHVLVLLARNPSLVLREVAQQVGITERAVQRIIADLENGGFVEREKIGRQNHYQIRARQPLRHPIESHRTIGDLLALLNSYQG